MVFAGIKKADERADLIAFLKSGRSHTPTRGRERKQRVRRMETRPSAHDPFPLCLSLFLSFALVQPSKSAAWSMEVDGGHLWRCRHLRFVSWLAALVVADYCFE